MSRVGVIDYGVGNLRSVTNALKFIGSDAVVSDDAATLLSCDRIIFPGVGAFGYGMRALRAKGLDEVVLEAAKINKPVLGICVGMQLLFEGSSEFGYHKGLGMLSGNVDIFGAENNDQKNLCLPNVSWLPVSQKDNSCEQVRNLFRGVSDGSKFYFIHSYHAQVNNPHTVASAEYEGLPFAAVVAKGSVIATQFHPEKSGPDGLRLLENFVS